MAISVIPGNENFGVPSLSFLGDQFPGRESHRAARHLDSRLYLPGTGLDVGATERR